MISSIILDFPWSKELEEKLKDAFQLSQFRPLQLRAINLSMSGKDLFLVMPTGRGKSLCYQLPAVCSEGKVTRTPTHSFIINLALNSPYGVVIGPMWQWSG